MLHDIGKLAIPDQILGKTGPLTDDEFDIIKTHTMIGEELALGSPAIKDLAPAIRGHHERMDGRGYPDGLAGQQIPLASRIIAACDAFDAMANPRQYRAGLGSHRATEVLCEHAGTQWDPRVVDALIRVVARRPPIDEARILTNRGPRPPGLPARAAAERPRPSPPRPHAELQPKVLAGVARAAMESQLSLPS